MLAPRWHHYSDAPGARTHHPGLLTQRAPPAPPLPPRPAPPRPAPPAIAAQLGELKEGETVCGKPLPEGSLVQHMCGALAAAAPAAAAATDRRSSSSAPCPRKSWEVRCCQPSFCVSARCCPACAGLV
jgi:hypothetical protein